MRDHDKRSGKHGYRDLNSSCGSPAAVPACFFIMAEKRKKTPTGTIKGHLNFTPGSYLATTSQPLYALIFLLPLIGLYEVGTILVNTDELARTSLRIVSFTWLMGLAEWLGVDQSFVWAFPGMVVVIILLFWHLSSHYSWKVHPHWLGWMALESVVLTFPLFVFSLLIHSSTTMAAGAGDHILLVSEGGFRAKVITSIGAGIYEELVFRLILIGLLLVIFEDLCKLKRSHASFIAVLVSAVLFAVHHYISYQDGQWLTLDAFKVPSFVFRTAAGIYFAVIFRYRGYGIAAGAHIAYDLIHFSLNSLFG